MEVILGKKYLRKELIKNGLFMELKEIQNLSDEQVFYAN